MKKQIYLSVLWIITAIIIILIATKKITGIHIHINDDDWDVSSKTERTYDSKYAEKIDESLQRFENININSNVMSITVKPGTEYHIYSTYNKPKYMPEFSVENGTLKVRQNFPKHNNNNVKCTVEITVPKNTVLSDIDIQNNVGEVILKDFEADEIQIETNVGEIRVSDMNFNNLKLENNVGEISVKTLEKTDKYNISARNDIGEISVGGKSYKHKFEQKNSSKKSIKAVSNVGEVSIH